MSIFKNIPEDSLLLNRSNPEDLLGSFSAHSFFLDDRDWPTAEHYYQAMKFSDPDYQEQIRNAPDVAKARRLGHNWLVRKRPDYKKVRVTLMTRAMYTKCRTYPKIAQSLIDTGEQYIAESSFSDYFWGCGRDGRGDNHFGRVLMSIRSRLLEEQQAKSNS
jgi:ribA/ribD-fused uncharacterized protein